MLNDKIKKEIEKRFVLLVIAPTICGFEVERWCPRLEIGHVEGV